MRDQFSNAQEVRKPAVVSKGGIVAAQSRKAAQVGAEVLAAGGDCVDAVSWQKPPTKARTFGQHSDVDFSCGVLLIASGRVRLTGIRTPES